MTKEELDILRVAKYKSLQSLLFFTRYQYKKRYDRKYIVAEPHLKIAQALEDVISGKITRLIINIAPRYGKTEIGVKNFIAHGLALNPSAKFIHLTYSQTLALDNSEETKDIVECDSYQALFDVKIKRDSKAKNKWYTTAGGGVYAAAAGGQVTGFGAGKVDDEEEQKKVEDDELSKELDDFNETADRLREKGLFAGAIIIDDPIKPEDAYSEIRRKRINDRFDSTIRSRTNSRKTPIIIIQQRVHAKDLSGHLMEVEPGVWTALTLPCIKEDGTALWELKHTLEELLSLKRINEYVFESQYQQNPSEIKRGGELLWNFIYKQHVKTVNYDPFYPLHVSIDNNYYPYIAMSAWQIIREVKMKVRQINELPAIEPDNSPSMAAKKLCKWLDAIEYKGKVHLYGDKSTKSRNTIDDAKRSFFQIIEQTIQEQGYYTEDKILLAPPPVPSIIDFVNAILCGEVKDMEIEISKMCLLSITDYQQTKKDVNGGMLKLRIKHPTVEGATYEKYGHLTDTMKDFIIQAFLPEYELYVNRFNKLITGGITQISQGPTAAGKITF